VVSWNRIEPIGRSFSCTEGGTRRSESAFRCASARSGRIYPRCLSLLRVLMSKLTMAASAHAHDSSGGRKAVDRVCVTGCGYLRLVRAERAPFQ
jgi:hypothetical protein